MKLCIFGGSFNPIHFGHINIAKEAQKKFFFDKFIILPNFKNPLRKYEFEEAKAIDRFNMAEIAFEEYKDFEVSEYEINKKEPSYTIEAVEFFLKKFNLKELYFMVGADHLYDLHLWKDYKELLKKVNFIFVSRPGYSLNSLEMSNKGLLADFVLSSNNKIIEFTTGKKLFFLELEGFDISSTQLRKSLLRKESVNEYIPTKVAKYIEEQKVYKSFLDSKISFEDLVNFCGQVLFNKNAIKVRGVDVRNINQPTDFNLIASGTNKRHVKVLAETVIKEVKSHFSINPYGMDGKEHGNWIALDYGGLIVHIFYEHTRRDYNLEKLWERGLDMGLVDKDIKK